MLLLLLLLLQQGRMLLFESYLGGALQVMQVEPGRRSSSGGCIAKELRCLPHGTVRTTTNDERNI